MLSRGRRRRCLVAASVIVVAAGTGSTWAATEGQSASVPTETFSAAWEAPTTPVPAVDAETRATFAIFRERPASPMPKEAAEQVGSPERYGRNPDLARAIDTPNGTGWVIPGEGFICLAMKDPLDGYGTGCVPTAVATRQGMLLRMGNDRGEQRIAEVALVPDGQEARRSDGTAVPLQDGIATNVSYGAGELEVAP